MINYSKQFISWKFVIGYLLLSIGLFLSSCAPRIVIRSSDVMYKQNPIKNIALITESMVFWPGMEGKNFIGIKESKYALGKILPMIEQELIKKGYTVSSSLPIALGHHIPDSEKMWWIINTETKKKWEQEGAYPVYIYPEAKKSEEFERATIEIFGKINQAFAYGSVNTFRIHPSNLQQVQVVTGGDTLGIIRISGTKYSVGRQLASFFLSGLSEYYRSKKTTYNRESLSPLEERIWVFIVFLRPNDGEILWQYVYSCIGNPISPPRNIGKRLLKYFPNKGQPINN